MVSISENQVGQSFPQVENSSSAATILMKAQTAELSVKSPKKIFPERQFVIKKAKGKSEVFLLLLPFFISLFVFNRFG